MKEILIKLLADTKKFENKLITLSDFKNILWEASNNISSIEHEKLRLMLQSFEAELDSLEFTSNKNEVFKLALKVTKLIKAKILDELSIKNIKVMVIDE